MERFLGEFPERRDNTLQSSAQFAELRVASPAMKVPQYSLRLTIALFIAATMCRAQSTNPLAGDPQAAETGRWTFRVLCAPCHGIHADGGRGPDLTRGAYSVGDQR